MFVMRSRTYAAAAPLEVAITETMEAPIAAMPLNISRRLPAIVSWNTTVTSPASQSSERRLLVMDMQFGGTVNADAARTMTDLVTSYLSRIGAISVVAGSEINDNPFAPVSKYGRNLLNEAGDDTPISWLEPDQRYVEKLATPDVTVALFMKNERRAQPLRETSSALTER